MTEPKLTENERAFVDAFDATVDDMWRRSRSYQRVVDEILDNWEAEDLRDAMERVTLEHAKRKVEEGK